MIKHFFNFITSGHGLREIEEPFGFKSAEFTIEQNDYYGRDINFAATKNRLTINRIANHCFNEMLYSLDHFGYEAVIEYIIEVNGNEYKFQVELLEHKTDGFNTIEFSLTELGKRALLRKRSDVKSDLMSGKDLDGNIIGQVPYTMAWFPAKPIIQVSEWTTPENILVFGATAQKQPGAGEIITNAGTNPAFAQKTYDIQDSLSFLARNSALNSFGVPNLETFTYLEAKETLTDVKIKLKNIDLRVYTTENGAGESVISASGQSTMVVRYGETRQTSELIEVYQVLFDETEKSYVFPTEFEINIPIIKRGHRLYIYLANRLSDVEFDPDVTIATYSIMNDFKNMDVEITATSESYPTVLPFIRVIDAIRYVVKSSSGLEVSAPVFDVGGQLYDQYITTSSLMRLLYDKPLNLSFKDIIDGWLEEFNAGYSINSNDIVVFQLYRDYYRNYNLGVFNQATTSQYDYSPNDRYKINQFTFKYTNYASQKENEEKNTFDVVHGETTWINGSKAAMNTKEVEVKSVRDAFYLEQMRRKAYDYSETSATSDDDKIGIVELVPFNEQYRFQTETSTVRHTANIFELTLFNNGSFSWEQLGIAAGDSFEIAQGANVGVWTVKTVDTASLVLFSPNDVLPVSNSEVSTTYTYKINNTITLKVRTNEGFSYVGNIQEGDNFTNLPYTPKRNMINFYNEWLATATLYSKTIPYRNTVYKNNPEAITQLIGKPQIIEGAELLPTGAILDYMQDEVELEMDFDEYMSVSKGAQDENGWIGFYNEWGLLIKIHPRTATWQMQGMDSEGGYYGIAKITGERRYEPYLLDIFGTGNGTIIVNGGQIGANDFKYEVDEYGKLTIFDEVGEALYPPVPYNRVKINNGGNAQRIQQAQTPEQLLKWLKTLK